MPPHNPRKRRAEDELLPVYAPKQPRTSPLPGELSARWIRVGKEAMGLFQDTGVVIFNALTNAASLFFGDERENSTQPQQQLAKPSQVPGHHPSYPISSTPSPSKTATLKPSGSGDTVIEPCNTLPSPPPSTSSSEASAVPASNEAGPSKPRLTVKFVPAAPPLRRQAAASDASTSRQPLHSLSNSAAQPDELTRVPPLPTPPPSNTSASSLSPTTNILGLYPQINDAIDAAIVRQSKVKVPRKIKHRQHIFHSQFKASVKDQLKKTREEMERDLYNLRKRTTGFQSSLKEFRGWLGYRERLEVLQKLETLAPSPSLEDLRDAEPTPSLSRTPSNPIASTTYIQRALRDAEKSLLTPKPVVSTPSLSRLRATQAKVSEQIDSRIRPKRPSLPETLPPEDEAKVDELLRKRGVISKCVREQVSDKDLQRLRPGQWLNDEIINFYGQMILCRAEEGKENQRESMLDVHYFSTFFWSKLKNEGYEKARLAKWTKKFDLFSKDVILIPVNHNNSHWTGAAINFRKKRIESYDSMNMDRAQVFKLLRGYLDAEHRNKKKKPFDFTGWVDWTLDDTPQQENGYDCGVFTCQFLETLARGEERFAFTQSNMHYLRRRMIWEIGHAKLRTDI
ncbi:Ulp1 protease domain-containing protein [Phanerochaete sordida]|uniref:Ulp1 protease domain-containing protein n=1 Tax=Phanerochaete sordida TaxID=48140 RepID=A0A9P3G4N2_9APHY|nr:Ulp1 protease domain-containing protein [Phanerochaete sordida]